MEKIKLKSNKLKSRVCTLLFTLGCLTAWSQQTVTGTVSDEDGPLPGASVVVKGTTTGVSTDFDGNFTIEASADDTLMSVKKFW
jgi:hypothetical protein